MNYHSFEVNVAIKFSVPVAIVLNHIAFWVGKNKANGKHLYEGRHWTYNSIKAFQDIFPYWTFKQMRSILEKLRETGLILTGNFNELGYDQTTWYALSDEGMKLYNILPHVEAVDNVTPICPFGQMDLPKRANSFAQKGKPIPDIKTDIKTDNKSFCKNEQKENKPVDNSVPQKPRTADRTGNEKKHAWTEKPKSTFADTTKQSTSYHRPTEEPKRTDPKTVDSAMMALPRYMRPKRLRETDTYVQFTNNPS